PNESWENNENNNWVEVLKKVGAAITHAQHSVEVIQRELGKDFPIIACPAPIPSNCFAKPQQIINKQVGEQYELSITKSVIDTANLNLQEVHAQKDTAQRIEITHSLLQRWSHEVLEDMIPSSLYGFIRNTYLITGTLVARSLRSLQYLIGNRKANTTSPFLEAKKENTTSISGIIYTSILNIWDHRKNHHDMISAFCHAFQDKADATLIIKTPQIADLYLFREKIINLLRRLPKFSCRVIVIGYYLNDAAYAKLMKATTYYVNTSYGEGQCLPLMEYMAAGVPAIAPQTTALKDYIFSSNAFVFKTAAVPTAWQHDERRVMRTVHYRPDWYSLIAAYQKSYQVAKTDPATYTTMALKANETMRMHASTEKAQKLLTSFLVEQLKQPQS
ncbi:MAG: glycosyltransferase, partial [Bacteroidota bacterium]